MTMKTLLTLLAGAAWLGLSPLSTAAQERLAVAPLSAPEELTFTGKSLSEAVVKQAGKQQLTVVGPEALAQRLGKDKHRALADCGASAPCLTALVRTLPVDRVVGGSLDKVGNAYRVSLVSADVRSGEVITTWEREVPVASRRLAAEVAEAAVQLLRGMGQGSTIGPAR